MSQALKCSFFLISSSEIIDQGWGPWRQNIPLPVGTIPAWPTAHPPEVRNPTIVHSHTVMTEYRCVSIFLLNHVQEVALLQKCYSSQISLSCDILYHRKNKLYLTPSLCKTLYSQWISCCFLFFIFFNARSLQDK